MKPEREENSEEEPEWVKSHHAAQKAADEGDTTEAQMQTMQAFAQILESAEETIAESVSLRELKIAHQCEAAFDWKGAEAAFERAIAAEIEEDGVSNQCWRSLAHFYSFLGRDEEALTAIQKSTQAARQLNLGEMFLAIALSAEISYLLHARDLPNARLLLDEAISINPDQGLMRSNLNLLEARYAV